MPNPTFPISDWGWRKSPQSLTLAIIRCLQNTVNRGVADRAQRRSQRRRRRDPRPSPAIDRVVGTHHDAPDSHYAPNPAIHGRYGARRLSDIFGYGVRPAESY